jgi:hypothetical protein
MDPNTQALLSILQRYNQAQQDQAHVAQFQRQQQAALLQHTQMMTANGTIPTSLSTILQQFPNSLTPAATLNHSHSTPQAMQFTPIPNVTVPTPPVYASHGLPSHPGLNVDIPLYYQQYLNQTLMCMCACASNCPVHDGNHSVLLPQQSTSNSLLGSHPLRHMVPQQPQVQVQRTSQSPSSAQQQRLLTQQLVNRTRQYIDENHQIHMQNQRRQVHLASAIAAVASGSSTSQPPPPQQQHLQPQPSQSSQSTSSHRDSSIRQKRPAIFGTDGRPSSKIRRVISMDGNTPSSSQVPTERFENSEISQSNNNNIIPGRSQSAFRACSNCQQRFSTSSPPAPICPCHNSDSCPYTGSVCQLCVYGVIPAQERPSQINPVVHQQLSNRNTHQQRHREAANLFYQQNLYETTPAPPPPAGGVLVVNNRAPFMDILFFTSNEPVTGISGLPHLPSLTPSGTSFSTQIAQQQIQTLHQVLSQNPHISEPPPIGATVDEIKKKTTIMSYIKDPNVPEEKTERCTVCLSDFETGDEVRTLNCSHLFHTECIDRWLIYNKKCPVCRVEMDKGKNSYGALCDLLRQSYEQVQQQQSQTTVSTNAAAS